MRTLLTALALATTTALATTAPSAAGPRAGPAADAAARGVVVATHEVGPAADAIEATAGVGPTAHGVGGAAHGVGGAVGVDGAGRVGDGPTSVHPGGAGQATAPTTAGAAEDGPVAEDVTTEGMSTEGTTAGGATTGGATAGSAAAGGTTTEGTTTEDTTTEGTTTEGTTAGSAAAGSTSTEDAPDPEPAGGDAQDRRRPGRFDVPARGWADDVLRPGAPEHVGLDRGPIDAAVEQVRRHTAPDATGRPLFAGAVTLLAHDGVVTTHEAAGWALRYADAAGTELPADRRTPMRPDTIFDLASISKLFTSIVVMREQERGTLDLAAPVARYLPEFGVNGKSSITVEQLLTHTSGLEPWLPLWSRYPDVPARIKAVLDVAPESPPGSAYRYSDLNLITLGVLVHRVTGKPLDVLVREGITEPLGLTDTGYNPPRAVLGRIAATEFQGARGLVHGEVHDENAWSLGGVAGHAGVFSTARDLATLGQAILNGGSHRHRRILRPETVELMLTDFNQEFPGNAHGLGFELDQRWYMGALTSPRTAGHTGFTGTSLVVDPLSRSIAVLLTNRVHPDRDRGSVNPARRAVADGLAHALRVQPRRGPAAWAATAGGGTLTTRELGGRSGRQRLEFSAFVDLDPADRVVVQAGDDGSTWRDLTTLSGYGGRRWQRVELVTEAAARYRWLFVRGDGHGGRGAYVDAVRVTDARGVLVDAEHEPAALRAVGWRSVTG
ncbi:serine hydrolase domain-containing protein [Saccharothrix algeriensis]|uniref:CubicO group peptidase (Beta-lactamase class C family) n=1 Tax=Saccharothrix algeriensis TaxID=173560 RepID=A0ABS2S9B1_9PSEU|nr:serine hydrolase domain-containing protein [Saccharothrix algeriensis]MBM7811883.1 CubicO group peptidase (beta-lactamase class C family) [Saccharothrix algeriensis]